MSDTVPTVIAHQLSSDGPECLLRSRDLNHDLRTVTVLFDHLLQPLHLALQSPQAAEVCGFRFGIDRQNSLAVARRDLRLCAPAWRYDIKPIGSVFSVLLLQISDCRRGVARVPPT